MIKGINVKKAFFTAALTGCILATGCTKVSAQDPIYFNGVDDASVATYCDIYIDGQEYFIRKASLASVLPKFDESYNIGLRIDEKGNMFLRFDKQEAYDENIKLSYSGDVIHVRIKIASYPVSKENAIKVAHKLFNFL